MSKTFRQADSRWGKLIYTRGGSTMAHAGCGPTSEADIIVNIAKYANADPRTTRIWMREHGYNIKGTTWDGIAFALKHAGFKWRSPSTMDKLWDSLGKDGYDWGIINFKAGSRNGVTWTSGGHYVAFSAYKYQDGQHWLYMRDPGARHNDGWFSYEKNMKGLCRKVWCAYDPEQKKKQTEEDKKVTVSKKKSCIDISEHQGKIDWPTCPIENIVIRASYTSTGSKFKCKTDKYFKKNIKGALKENKSVGIYHFSQAKTVEEARAEAQYLLKVIKPYKTEIKLPVAIDWEFNDRLTPSTAKDNGKKKNGKVIDAFCTIIEAAGYKPMVYANLYTFTNYLPDDLYKRWKIWIAQYSDTCSYKHPYYLWQYSSNGRVLGISGNVDMDKFYAKPKETTKAPDPKPTQKLLKVGSKIKIKKGACQYGSSKHFADFVYQRTYKVKSIAGNRVVFTTLDGKTVMGAVSRADCIVQ